MSPDAAIARPLQGANGTSIFPEHARPHTIVGTNNGLKHVFDRIDQVADTDVSVLLLGETGTGKELIARAIHQRSRRRQRGFVVVDCGALPPSLIESELFGRERGAYTGADIAQAGRFEVANGGTIFLDEIAELPIELQPKLLRVLQEGQVDRLGSTRTIRTDIRVIAATNRNLVDEIRRGRFRRDLFYRLNVFPIALPALRERREDLPVLVRHFCDRLGRQVGKRVVNITPGSFDALRRYEWPGNIRELENVILQALIVARGDTLDLSHFVGEPLETDSTDQVWGQQRSLADVERDHIQTVLRNTSWRIEGMRGAARILGLQPSTLRSRMIKLGLRRPDRALAEALN
jgi:transcriptional regulator with GAF, ATPase, and Fis domain